MDILDRLTNKAALQKAYDAKDKQLTAINAEELAAKLKARVIGQNDVIDRDRGAAAPPLCGAAQG